MLTLLSFILVVVVVVSVHEYGHYLAARWYGVRVLRFSVGFGKPLARRVDKHGTEWVLAPIPLGGYVRLLDADAARILGVDDSASMEAQTPLARIVIYAAGPLANFVLSFALALVILAGGEQGIRPLLGDVRPNTPAAAAGLAAGDEIATVNAAAVQTWRQMQIRLTDAIAAREKINLATTAGGGAEIPTAGIDLTALAQPGGAAAALGLLPSSAHVKLSVDIVAADSPAAAAGIRRGDEIVMLDGAVIEHWRDAVAIIVRHPDMPLPLVVWRDGGALTLTVTPQAVKRGRQTQGYLGVAPVIDLAALEGLVVTIDYSPPALAAAAARQTGGDILRVLLFLKLVIGGGASSEHISGPVGIATQSGEAATLGIGALLRFITLISTSLGMLNLLPLPLLDGGQIVLNMLQWISKRAPSERFLRLWQGIGIAIIFTLMAFAIINDIYHLF